MNTTLFVVALTMEHKIRLAVNDYAWRLIGHTLAPGKVVLHLTAATNHASNMTYWRATFTAVQYTPDIIIMVPDFFEEELNKQLHH
jgi:hypothetical protein